MAQIQHGGTAGITGLVGNLVFVQGKGKTIIRSRPVHSKNSWSGKQLQHRERFSKVNAFCQSVKRTVIVPIWNRVDADKVGYNLFLKANMAAFALNGELADQSLLHFSEGSLPPLLGCRVQRLHDSDGTIFAEWINDPLMDKQLLTDELWAMVATKSGIKGPVASGLVRGAGSGQFMLPSEYGEIAAIWLFWASVNREHYSADRYFKL